METSKPSTTKRLASGKSAKKSDPNQLEAIRTALQKEFIARCKRNPSYSLRAFAQFLEIDQSFLSKLLNGQRRITESLASSIGPKLGLRPTQIEKLFANGSAKMPGFISLSEEEFETIGDWKTFAIIELAKTINFNPDPKNIAKRLGVHVEEVRASIDRLKNLGYIQIHESGWKLLAPNTTWTNTTTTTEARRRYQKSILEKGLLAIDQIPFDQRDNGSLTIAIEKSRIPEFKEKLLKIRQELGAIFQPSDHRSDEVYQLTIALFPLTKFEKE